MRVGEGISGGKGVRDGEGVRGGEGGSNDTFTVRGVVGGEATLRVSNPKMGQPLLVLHLVGVYAIGFDSLRGDRKICLESGSLLHQINN